MIGAAQVEHLDVGELVWNEEESVKHHATGKRRRIARPESEWIRREDEAWRIIPPDLWDAVQDRFAARRGRPHSGAKGRHKPLLAGLLACDVCGGAFFDLKGRGLLSCSWRANPGPSTCANTLRVPVARAGGARAHGGAGAGARAERGRLTRRARARDPGGAARRE